MNNIVFVKTPTFIVNANGRLSESVRPDENKGQRKLTVETRNFENLRTALAWINKEGQKKSTTLFLYEIRPAAHGTYNVRFAINSVKPVAKKATNTKANVNSNNNAKTISNATNANNAKRTSVKK
jgi:hypothetical protein